MIRRSADGWLLGAAGRAALTALVIGSVMMAVGPRTAARTDMPPGKSVAPAKELAALLTAKSLQAYATHDGDPYKFVAVLITPGVEMFSAAATYSRPGDLDYQNDHKDYLSTYTALRSGIDAKDKFIIEDIGCDGLVGSPHKHDQPDTATFADALHTFDGLFSDPGHHDAHKMAYDDYLKAFTTADTEYARILGVLTDALKK